MKISQLAGLFTGTGFVSKQGRRPSFEDCGYTNGPIDVIIDETSGRILEISKGAASGKKVEQTIDGRGLVATAGYVDSHTHSLFAGERSREFFMRWRGATYVEISQAGGGIFNTNNDTAESSDAELMDLLKLRLERMRSHGTTSVEVKSGYAKDPQGELRLLRVLKTFREQNARTLPEMKVSFLGLHALPKGAEEKTFVDGMIEILPSIKKEGLADYIDAFPEKGFFSLEESLRFANAGIAAGLKAKIHADEITDMNAAETFARTKALSVDHLQQISSSGIQSLAQSPTVATLLPATSFFLGLPYAKARALLDAGVRVALATDFNPGTAPRIDMPFTQLLAATQFRMSPAEILCASTYNGAAAMGFEDERGTLEKGRRADILLWSTPKATGPQEILEHVILGAATLQCVVIGGVPTRT